MKKPRTGGCSGCASDAPGGSIGQASSCPGTEEENTLRASTARDAPNLPVSWSGSQVASSGTGVPAPLAFPPSCMEMQAVTVRLHSGCEPCEEAPAGATTSPIPPPPAPPTAWWCCGLVQAWRSTSRRCEVARGLLAWCSRARARASPPNHFDGKDHGFHSIGCVCQSGRQDLR